MTISQKQNVAPKNQFAKNTEYESIYIFFRIYMVTFYVYLW